MTAMDAGSARRLVPILLAGLCGLGGGCAAEVEVEPLPFEPAGPEAAPDPSQPGPFPVGVRTLEFEDESRLDEDSGEPRRLVVEVWYPATESARDGPPEEYRIEQFLPPDRLDELDVDALPPLVSSAVRDAPARTDRAPYPLVVFSHGFGAIRVQSTFYTVVLASHGYVVVSPDHGGNTLADLLAEDGEQEDSLAEVVADRPDDVLLLVDAFTADPHERLDDADPLAGMARHERIGTSGHSFGGFTALSVAFVDPRVAVTVPQAPPHVGLASLGSGLDPDQLRIPTMLQCAGRDGTLPMEDNCEPSYDLLSPPRYRVVLPEAGHFTFTDLCRFDLGSLAEQLDIDVGDVLDDGCGPDYLAAELAEPAIDHFAVALMNLHLRDSPASADYLGPAAADSFRSVELLADP